MNNLLRKEFGLAIHPLYLAAAFAFGALALIPQWIYLLIPLYFCFITVPNVLAQLKSNKDNEFSALLPVTRRSIVAARILSFLILELLHVLGVAIFVVIHNMIYSIPNFGLDLGAGYLGVVFIMYGGFNLVLFPLYYRTAQKFGLALILAVALAMVLGVAAEVLVQVSPVMSDLLENRIAGGIPILLAGVLVFAVTGYAAFRASAKRFETVQL